MKASHIALLFALMTTTLLVSAQSSLPITTISGQNYHYYVPKGKESIHEIARMFGSTLDELQFVNPSLEQGVQKGVAVLMPVASATDKVRHAFDNATTTTDEATTPQEQPAVDHTIEPGETLLTIAQRYNASVEGLLADNPGLRPDDYAAGERIRVRPGTASPLTYQKATLHFRAYKVESNDSYFALARRLGVDPDALAAANPGLKKPKKGKMLTVPQPATFTVTAPLPDVPLADLTAYYNPLLDQLVARQAATRQPDEIRIAMVLPFQLHKSAPPKQAYLYTDFYKGFLLALDSVGTRLNKRVNLTVLDTQHNLNVTDSLLALPLLRTMDVVIAPSEPKQLARINEFGRLHSVKVLNCFDTKSDTYADNPFAMQANIPTADLTKHVMEWIDEQFPDCTAVYLVGNDDSGKDIFNDIAAQFNSRERHRGITLRVAGELTFDQLSRVLNPGTKYLLIPSSGSKELLRKILPAAKRVKTERFDCDIALLGYPEYVQYLKDYQTDLQDVDTYIFSRFFNTKGFRTRDIETRYAKWFAGQMLVSYPNMGLYGFDTAMFLLHALSQPEGLTDDTPLYKGIQTSFKFRRPNHWSGLVNEAIDITHFSPDHKIERTSR